MTEDALSSAIDIFLKDMRSGRGRSGHTTVNYAVDLSQFAEYVSGLGVETPGGVETTHIRGFLRDVVGFGYARSSAARKLSAIKSWLRFLQERGEISRNPAGGLRGPKLPSRLPRAISREEMNLLLEKGTEGNEAPRDLAVLELMYGSGLRIAETAALRWDQVDLAERWIRVLGKGEKERLVPMGRFSVRALESWRDVSGPGSDFVFPGAEGGAVTVRTLHRVVRRAAARAGLSGVTPHVLRHSFATHMLEGGANLRVLQELLGHESLVTTQKYLKITAEQMRRSYTLAHPRAGNGDENDEGNDDPLRSKK
ncbi:MAG: tyrosine recombinase XerC [Thermovirgaceae bacterium]|nr:tyrosine recombinase XerC [Thermovirgaceae bacterium]